eukprot:TRINITY_DN9211_c0_g1_i2.p1 TRINITY_DN9211_c0_g1~~TRINITY_DN9211_c0_g1_i2.p1  ORF type:complete len:119 (+),score=16.12 TRINITY_DN9211_c0_g1_i2:41-397(+)
MFRLTRKALLTAPSVAQPNLPPSKVMSKGFVSIDREPDTTSDLGARNEAAYFDYTAFETKGIREKYAMPSLNNLMTSVFFEMVFIFGCSAFLGMLSWSFYSSQKYTVVQIPYPEKKAE